jgi:hypothetical protein
VTHKPRGGIQRDLGRDVGVAREDGKEPKGELGQDLLGASATCGTEDAPRV